MTFQSEKCSTRTRDRGLDHFLDADEYFSEGSLPKYALVLQEADSDQSVKASSANW
jgi:hypothetical protein